jgi:hypothetical protein
MITNFEIVGPYLAALMMSLGALCIFIWGVFSGALIGGDDAAKRFYHMEMGDDGTSEQRPGEPDAPRTDGA